MHIGTGAMAVESFLHTEKAWIERSFGIFVAGMPRNKPESAGKILLDPKSATAKKILEEINSRLGKQDIILSSDDFLYWEPEHWKMFKSHLADSGLCLRLLMVHRRGSDHMFSQWYEENRIRTSPQSFGIWFLKNSPRFSTDYQLKIWNTASAASGAGALGVSYEYLDQQRGGLAAFLICNATLREGASWRQCAESIESQMKGHTEHVSTSSPAVLDVYRLAYGIHRQVSGDDDETCTFDQTAEANGATLVKVAQQVPLRCGTFDEQFQLEEDEWFKQTGAKRPAKRSKTTTCLVEEAKLKTQDWNLIKQILSKCSKGKP